MEILAFISIGFGVLFFLGIILGILLPPEPGTWEWDTGGMPRFFTLWMMGIGFVGLILGYTVLYFLGAFDTPETKYKKLEIEVPESIQVDTRFYQDSQEVHRESL